MIDIEKLRTLYKFGKELTNKKIVLITSSSHMRRSIACFKAEGLKFDYLSTNRQVGDRKFEFEYCFIPSAAVFSGWHHLAHEMFGYFTYWLTGKI